MDDYHKLTPRVAP